MQLVAKFNNTFFRAQSVTENNLEKVKESMLQDQQNLEFEILTDEEFEKMLAHSQSEMI